ncbi:tyrosine-type recombinase/integrase [Scatolibacter rhodanostii]|uniref:tyrosine-type recombinase/integrase n=1 Tax=Scatolibacter rhodanostii TaxID=2014781 RepID=UPI000C0690FA|nr:site-specific integrase [Scatolibacter rhodanostii]
MATVRKQGKGYQITASKGYDIYGKQLREYMTWIPEPHMTDLQIKKELERQKVLFEEKVKNSFVQNGNIRLIDFTDVFFKDYGNFKLKRKTIRNYKERMQIINQALGHIKLKELNARHINSFYANLREKGIRRQDKALCKIDLATWLKKHKTTSVALNEKYGISMWAFKQAKHGKLIDVNKAKEIAVAIGEDFNKVFTVQKDERPLEGNSALSYHRTLSAVLSKAVKWNYIEQNPAARAEIPSKGKKEAAYLEDDDARKLLELLQDEPIKWRTIITLDLLSGLRRGELLGLYWNDLDYKNQLVRIRRTLNYIPEEGVYEDTTKSEESDRILKLPKSAFLLLSKYKEWQNQQRELLGDVWEDKDGRIFTSNTGGFMFPDSITKWFSSFIDRSNLPKVTVHSLRHTYASLMIADDIPIVTVSKQLGHAQVSTTANIYAHAIKSAQAKAVEVFDRFDDVVIPAETVADEEDNSDPAEINVNCG